MKRNNLFLGVTMLFIALLTSCTTEEYGYSKHYIDRYVTPSKATIEASKYCVSVKFDGYTYSSGMKYEAFAEKFGDTNYDYHNGKYNSDAGGPCTAMNDSILEAKVITVDNFDGQHTAGSDISDLINVQYASFSEFINSGYTTAFHGTNDDEFRYFHFYDSWGCVYHQKKLSELTETDTRLIGLQILLLFNQQPQQEGTHKFRLVLKTSQIQVDEEFEYTF